MSDKVSEMVERVGLADEEIDEVYFECGQLNRPSLSYLNERLAQRQLNKVLKDSEIALIDKICSATLDWHESDIKAQQDMPCDNWDCSRDIKKGETYYIEEYIKEDQCHTWCVKCAAYFMAQKLSYIISLAESATMQEQLKDILALDGAK